MRMASRRGEMNLDATDGDANIPDNGGARSGNDRRQNQETFQGEEKRLGEDRRHQDDRRSGLTRRQKPDRRDTTPSWDGNRIERRDAFRKDLSGNKYRTP